MERKETFEFYKLIRSEEISWLNLHQQYTQQYLKLISAILAISLGALYQFRTIPFLLIVVIVGPSLNIFLCITAIKMCNRFYQRFLECITIQAKIEPLIGIIYKRKKKKNNTPNFFFPKDEYYFPERWLESRKNHNSSLDFIKNQMRSGSNKYVQLSFRLLLGANILLIIAIIISIIMKIVELYSIHETYDLYI